MTLAVIQAVFVGPHSELDTRSLLLGVPIYLFKMRDLYRGLKNHLEKRMKV